LSGDQDIYVPANQIRRFNLRTGDKIVGKIKMSGENEKYDALLYVETVNGDMPEKIAQRPKFEQLTPIFPNQKITLETDRDVLSTRIIDVFAPVGKGQRGLIVAPPKAGKTILLKEIANGITTNHKEIELIILLVDERPEEVTDISRSVDADIVYSTFDQPPENHIRVAEIVLERGKRLVEQGKDVVILVDSITRMTRANNLVVSPSGRTLSGGLDPESLYFPKKFFGSARKIEEGGSLTILATALLDTGSRMDDVIYEEFKGTGNMELHLERELAERRIYPAINLSRSGTRREELILSEDELKVSFDIRRIYKSSTVYDLTDKIITILERTKNNEEFLLKFLEKYNAQNV
ncbi:MAG: transcription termination factor Rho, partial [Eubacteriaceae bacterium]|nr:transcription termination factor Rho [Eubacteriaceae bacterium]